MRGVDFSYAPVSFDSDLDFGVLFSSFGYISEL